MRQPPEGDSANQQPADWLEGSTGFVVESDAGRLGRVLGVDRDPESRRPRALVVRAGKAGWRRLVVPVDDVAGVIPSSRRIVLASSVSPWLKDHGAANPAH